VQLHASAALTLWTELPVPTEWSRIWVDRGRRFLCNTKKGFRFCLELLFFWEPPYLRVISYCYSPSLISRPLHIVPLSPLFSRHFTLFLSVPYFHATSYYSSLSPISTPLHIVPLSSISKPLHIVSLPSLFLGHFTFPSLLYFQTTAHYSSLSPTTTTQNVFRRRKAAPVVSCATLHKCSFCFWIYISLHLSPHLKYLPRFPGVPRKHE